MSNNPCISLNNQVDDSRKENWVKNIRVHRTLRCDVEEIATRFVRRICHSWRRKTSDYYLLHMSSRWENLKIIYIIEIVPQRDWIEPYPGDYKNTSELHVVEYEVRENRITHYLVESDWIYQTGWFKPRIETPLGGIHIEKENYKFMLGNEYDRWERVGDLTKIDFTDEKYRSKLETEEF
jgi:hypothetical protein